MTKMACANRSLDNFMSPSNRSSDAAALLARTTEAGSAGSGRARVEPGFILPQFGRPAGTSDIAGDAIQEHFR